MHLFISSVIWRPYTAICSFIELIISSANAQTPHKDVNTLIHWGSAGESWRMQWFRSSEVFLHRVPQLRRLPKHCLQQLSCLRSAARLLLLLLALGRFILFMCLIFVPSIPVNVLAVHNVFICWEWVWELARGRGDLASPEALLLMFVLLSCLVLVSLVSSFPLKLHDVRILVYYLFIFKEIEATFILIQMYLKMHVFVLYVLVFGSHWDGVFYFALSFLKTLS